MGSGRKKGTPLTEKNKIGLSIAQKRYRARVRAALIVLEGIEKAQEAKI